MMCCVCNKELSGGITHIQRHSASKVHIKSMAAASTSKKITDMIPDKVDKLQKIVKTGELKLVMFVAEHNLPLRTLDHLPKLISSICPDSKIAKNLQCGRKKGTNICLQSTGPFQFKQIVSALKRCYFSLIILSMRQQTLVHLNV